MVEASPAVLIIDSDQTIMDSLSECAGEIGVQTIHATSLQKGLLQNKSKCCDVILVRDILPDGASCYAVQDLLSEAHAPEIIIYSTTGNPDHAEHALKCGVWDYIVDPSPERLLPDLLKRAIRYRQSRSREEQSEEEEIRHEFSDLGIIGRSKEMQNCLNLAAKISQSDANVLITGESGTGKELFANAIHNFSHRSQKKLTVVDCAALPSTLVESILFGHSRGSFTGADKAQQGLIKQADGGTLFLDEIGEMPLEIQKKFLRVIQERKYRPVGSSAEIKSDFRLLAATNKDLDAMVKEGGFREDLLFRLKTFHLELPPLRTRPSDITELAYFYRNDFCKRVKLKKKKFSADYLMILTQYDWPGNVRELFQAIERSITDAQSSLILYPKHLPTNIRVAVTRKKLQDRGKTQETTRHTEPPVMPAEEVAAPYQAEGKGSFPTLKEERDKVIEAVEKKYLESLLARTDGNIKESCRIADLSRSRLYDLLKKYDISK